jgi:UDP-N-acetylmuramoyl-tripeptide--D-alanyl-D-alanine ligase
VAAWTECWRGCTNIQAGILAKLVERILRRLGSVISRIQFRLRQAYPIGIAFLLSAGAFLWRRLMFRTTFIAISGSVGKSTATASLGTILSAHYATNWLPGGRNHRRILAETILRTRFRHRFTVIEVGTRAPGALKKAAWMIAPDIVVKLRVLNVHSHAFPSLEDMAAEKAQLLSRLGRRGLAILNADDPRVLSMGVQRRGPLRTFGTSPEAFVTASEVSSKWPRRLSFRVRCGHESSSVETNLVGEQMLTSALSALTAAVCCGVPLAQAAACFKEIQPVPGRMQPMQLPNGVTVIRNEYNAVLATFEAALEVMRDAEGCRRIVIVGDVLDSGLSERARFRHLGLQVAGAADMGIFVGRSSIASVKGAIAAGMNQDSAVAFKMLPDAVNFLKLELRAGDLVLLHGWAGRHLERLILAQLGSISCWVERCNKIMQCESCPELKLVRLPVRETGSGAPQDQA